MKFFHLLPARIAHIGLLMFILLIALLHDVSEAVTTTHSAQPHDVESRQFSGLHGNTAALKFGGSNVASSSLSSLSSPFNKPTFSTTNSGSTLNNLNSINDINKKETNKITNKENNQKDSNINTRILDRFNHRYPDGSYEYRYELDDGTARYERGYFLLYDNKKTLVVVGYYAYRLADGRYLTVFYNADQNGYRQNQSITSQSFPNLPRSIEVPQYKSSEIEGEDYTKMTTTLMPKVTTKPTKQKGVFKA